MKQEERKMKKATVIKLGSGEIRDAIQCYLNNEKGYAILPGQIDLGVTISSPLDIWAKIEIKEERQ